MIDHVLDQVAAAVRRRDEMVSTLRPRLLEILGEIFQGLVLRQLPALTIQVADEDGIRRYCFLVAPVERFESLYRVKVTKNTPLTPPLFVAELFRDGPPALRSFVKPLDPDDVADLYTFLSDLRAEDGHARLEVTPDAVAVLLKPRAH
jgi:hypothetical protein